MTATDLPPVVIDWLLDVAGADAVEGLRVEPLTGGAVSARVERLTVRVVVGGSVESVDLVRKWGLAHELAGLRAAQVVRPEAAAVPELIADGHDQTGWWLITPLYEGVSVDATALPAVLFDSLARIHAHYLRVEPPPGGIPVVDAAWWRELCTSWAAPIVRRSASRHPAGTIRRALDLLGRLAGHPAISDVLGRLEVTLLHGDVHPGNVLVHDDEAHLVDWGSARIGPPMLDLANVINLASWQFAAYGRAWEHTVGACLDDAQVSLGYQWAHLQIPIQYLPWTVQNRSTSEVEAALDRAEEALLVLNSS